MTALEIDGVGRHYVSIGFHSLFCGAAGLIESVRTGACAKRRPKDKKPDKVKLCEMYVHTTVVARCGWTSTALLSVAWKTELGGQGEVTLYPGKEESAYCTG